MSDFTDHLRAGRARHLVCYGTSLTACGAWVAQVAAALARQFGDLVRVTNAGEGRQHSRWGLTHLQERVIDQQPDAVLIEFAINDALTRFGISPDESRDNLARMIDRITAAHRHCRVIPQVMNPAVNGSLPHADRRPRLSVYEARYRNVAHERALTLIDHAPRWRQLLAQGGDAFRAFVPDGLHPNDEGCARVVTPNVLAELRVNVPAAGCATIPARRA